MFKIGITAGQRADATLHSIMKRDKRKKPNKDIYHKRKNTTF